MATAEPVTPSPGPITAAEISTRIDRLPFLPFHFRIAGILGVGTFFDAFDTLSIATAITMIYASFHLDYRMIGTLIGAAYGGQFLGAILFGYLAEHIGRKWSFTIALGLFGLCSAGAALALSVNGILWARAIQGIGLGAANPLAAALFAEFVRSSARGFFVMVYETLFVWGLFLAPVAALLCLTAFGPALGWRALFALGGIPFFIAVIAAFKLPESVRWLAAKGRLVEADATVRHMEDEAHRLGKSLFPTVSVTVRHERTRFTELFRGIYGRRTLVSWSMAFSSYFIANTFTTWAPTLYMRIGGLPASRAIMLQILTGGLTLLVVYVVAATIDRTGRVRWFVYGFGLSAFGAVLGMIVTGPLGVHTWPALLVCGTTVQAGVGITAGVVGLYLPELYPTRMRAWATSMGSSLNRIGAFLAPLAVGWIMAEMNAIALVFAMLMAVALYPVIVISIWGEETKRRPLEELAR